MARRNIYWGDLIEGLWEDTHDESLWKSNLLLTLNVTLTGDFNTDNTNIRNAMTARNDEGGVFAWAFPPQYERYYHAHSPIIVKAFVFKFALSRGELPAGAVAHTLYFNNGDYSVGPYYWYHDETQTDTAMLDVYDRDDNKQATLRADMLKGIATFNVSPIVRSMFGTSIDENDYDNPFVANGDEPMLYTLFKLVYDDAPSEAGLYIAVNGVNDAGQNNGGNYIKSGTEKILSQPQELINWVKQGSGTHIERCYNAAPEVTKLYNPSNLMSLPSVKRIPIRNATDFIREFLTTDGFTYSEPDLSQCSPMLIRWLNDKGGMEQKVFLRHQFRDMSSKTNGMREVYTEGMKGENANERAYAIESEETMTLGVENVTEQEYKRLMTMATSPFIEWLDTSFVHTYMSSSPVAERRVNYPRWFAVSVNKYEGTRDYGAKAHTFEITINMPKRDTQFG